MESTTPAGQPIVDRQKTVPFLIRAFIKVGAFHRLNQFEDGPLPIADEQQIFTWKDATLPELITTLRSTAPQTAEYRHPLARFSFRTVYADSASRGRYSQKDLGMVYSRDIIGEPGTLDTPAPGLLEDAEDSSSRQKDARTLGELRFVPGDYLCIAVYLPKSVTAPVGPLSAELTIKGSGGAANGWKNSGTSGAGRVADAFNAGAGIGRGAGGHWRGGSDAPRGRGGARDGSRRPGEATPAIEKERLASSGQCMGRDES
ncbi:hypothetical protein EW146_g6172 [Bondarzewia mesenterica]|uniref:Histone deacetylase complex subunit SAP18 n=1 Tax=Bondarzewia mesenterica TaxID=1095465 RepID=A0A4S4LRG3_9AGAM|nr:hypothetical protein EW146_g6172 [Bondarzewia mesenterica]